MNVAVMRILSFSTFNIRELFQRIFHSFVFQRIAAAGIVFLCSFLMAKMLGPRKFGYLAFVLYLTKFLINGHLGSVGGYIFSFFNKSNTLLNCKFPLYYGIHLCLVVLVILLSGHWLGENYQLAAILFFILIPMFVLEPILRAHKSYYVSLLPDLLLYSGTALVVLLVPDPATTSIKAIVYSTVLVLILLSLMALFLLVRNNKNILTASWHPYSEGFFQNLKNYMALIEKGFILYLGSMAFTIFLFVDRFFLERFHEPNALGIYMLAIQLTTGVSMVISSQNFVNVVTIGEMVKNNNDLVHKSLIGTLRWSLFVALISFTLLIISAVIIEKIILPDYHGLVLYCIPLGLGFIAFYVSGSITPILFFSGRQTFPTLLMFLTASLCVAVNILIVFYHIKTVFLPWFTGAWLLCYSLIAICYSVFVAKRIK